MKVVFISRLSVFGPKRDLQESVAPASARYSVRSIVFCGLPDVAHSEVYENRGIVVADPVDIFRKD